MRHAFSFPREVRDAVRHHVYEAYAPLSPERFEPEASWVAGLAAGLEGVAYDGAYGRVEIRSTVVNALGRGSAETEFGADLAITATVSDRSKTVRKAILVQARRGFVEHLSDSQSTELRDQIRRMQLLTQHPKILEIPTEDGLRRPRVLSGARIAAELSAQAVVLEDYFTRRVLTTLDGDTRGAFVARVQRSGLTQVDVEVIRTTPHPRDEQQSFFPPQDA